MNSVTLTPAKAKKIAFLAVKWFFLLLLSVFFLFPIYALLINSFMPDEQLLGVKTLWPIRAMVFPVVMHVQM